MIIAGGLGIVGVVVFVDAWRHCHPRRPPVPPAPRLIGWAIDGCGRPRTRLRLTEWHDPAALLPTASARWQAAQANHQIGATP